MDAEKIAEPNGEEDKAAFMDRCMTFFAGEGKTKKQARAICSRVWDEGTTVAATKPAKDSGATGRVEREKTGLAAEKALGDRRMMFIMSDESPDRAGDIVMLDGWNLDGFMRNPVFLSMHDANRYPIGTWEKVWVEDGKLLGIARFADAGTHPEADLAYSLYKQGIMNAVSVKFLGDQYEPNEHGGLTFTSQELLECSAVPVPANANALAIAKDYDKRTREMFLRGSETAPDGTEEKADGTGDGSPIRGHDPEEDPYEGVHVSAAALDRILANLKIGSN